MFDFGVPKNTCMRNFDTWKGFYMPKSMKVEKQRPKKRQKGFKRRFKYSKYNVVRTPRATADSVSGWSPYLNLK